MFGSWSDWENINHGEAWGGLVHWCINPVDSDPGVGTLFRLGSRGFAEESPAAWGTNEKAPIVGFKITNEFITLYFWTARNAGPDKQTNVTRQDIFDFL